jgi:16S rRNA (guanine527-N7)-methyltransferase
MLEDLERDAGNLGIQLSSESLSAFEALLEVLKQANERMNLTSVRDDAGIVRRHFLESIALGSELDRRGLLAGNPTVLDLGSGAGFPGLPIKIAWPNIVLYLLEATKKKADFIQTAVDRLQLKDCVVLNGRAEMLAHQGDLRERFDCVIARAVVPLPALVELAVPFIRTGGTVAAVKGSRAGEEIEQAAGALQRCGALLSEHLPSITAGPAGAGLVLLRKIAATPARYPRRTGQPAAHPIRNPG